MRVLLTFGVVALLALAAVPAKADVYYFTSDHCTGGCLDGLANMGTISVTDTGTAGTVAVSVNLASGFGFVETGAGSVPASGIDASFFFRLIGNPQIIYSGITAGWGIPNVIPTLKQNAGAYAGGALAREFEYALTCTICGNGASNPFFGALNFNVSAAGLTAASFNDPGSSGSQFAADVISTTGNTGLIDASLARVPEPGSLLLILLNTGLALCGASIIRRKR